MYKKHGDVIDNNKRFIKLLDVSLIASVEKQFREIMNG